MRRKWFLMAAALLVAALGGTAARAEETVTDIFVGDSTSPAEERTDTAASGSTAQDLLEGVSKGRSVFVHDKGVAFFGWSDKLCSSLVDGDGQFYDYVVEGQMGSDIRYVAVSGSALYLGNSDGLYRVELEDFFGGGTVHGAELHDFSLIDGFSVYGDYVYFRFGNSVYRVYSTGGERELVADGVSDWEVTNGGVFYTDENGGLYLGALDGGFREHLTDTPPESQIALAGDSLFYKGHSDGQVYCLDLEDRQVAEIPTERPIREGSTLWANEDYLLYYSEDLDVYRIDRADGTETELHSVSSLPEKDKGCLRGNMLYQRLTGTLYLYDLERDEDVRLELEEVYSAQMEQAGSAGEGGYNILENFSLSASEGTARLETKHFTLYLPGDIPWDCEAVDDETFRIVYTPARDAGYGGTVVTVRAYDWADNGYADFPSWSIAGLSNEKKYVAIFPTDVQYDPGDSVQAGEYGRLLARAKCMDTDADSDQNPFLVEEF